MKRLILILAILPFLLAVTPDADARREGRDRNSMVWVLGGRYSNTYHPNWCSRCERNKRSARAVRLWWAEDRGLRAHRGCAPRRRR